MSTENHTPEPWYAENIPGAGLEIRADVSAVMGEEFANTQVQVFGLGAAPAPRIQIAYERWVQFPKREWDEMQAANARRIVACVNACAGVDNDTLSKIANKEMTGSEIFENAHLKQQRDELLAVMKDVADNLDGYNGMMHDENVAKLYAAISKLAGDDHA